MNRFVIYILVFIAWVIAVAIFMPSNPEVLIEEGVTEEGLRYMCIYEQED